MYKSRDFTVLLQASAYFKCKPGYKAVYASGPRKGKLAKSPTITCSKEGWSIPKSECIKVRRQIFSFVSLQFKIINIKKTRANSRGRG